MNDESLSDVCSNISDMSCLSDFDDECQSVNFDLSNGSPIDVNNFNIVHYNINSITAEDRLEQLSDICKTLNLAVLVITESKFMRVFLQICSQYQDIIILFVGIEQKMVEMVEVFLFMLLNI